MGSADARVLKPAPHAFIASAQRTLDTEREGLAALAAAMCDGLGPAFVDAVDTIRRAHGRLIVSGMGKSGHIARKIAATFASTGTPAFFVHAADASHAAHDQAPMGPANRVHGVDKSGAQSVAHGRRQRRQALAFGVQRPQRRGNEGVRRRFQHPGIS